MNCKKLNLWLLLSLFMAVFTLSACGGSDSDDDTPPTSSLKDSKWYVEQTMDGQFLCYETYIFTNDGKAMWGNLIEDNGQWHKFVRHTYSFTVSGNQITLTASDHTQRGTYTINGDVLNLNIEDGWEVSLKRMTGDVLDKYNSAIEDNIW